MSVDFSLDAELRADMGKGASRRLRRANKVPAIIYGADADPQSITLDHNVVLQRLENEAFYSHILTLNIGGKAQEAILRDIQRHPSKPQVLHMDFQRISKDKAVHVHVPLHFINEDKCVGVKVGGGGISKIITEVEVSCLPKDLPEFIEVDVANVALGEAIQLSGLVLPEGVELVALSHDAEHDTAVVTVHKLRGSSDDAEEKPADDSAAASGGDDSSE